jgi:6-phosphogluconolactonase
MRQVIILPDPAAVASEAARRLVEIARAAVAARRRCTLALAGGGTPAPLYRLLAARPWRDEVSWSQVHLFWGDERCVPPEHPDSNYGAAQRDLLAHVPVPPAQIHRMAGEGEPAAGAAAYAATLADCFGETPPRFDLILLGLGQDGHIASLFPGAPALELTEQTVAATVSPAGQARLTLTFTTLNAARCIVILVAGAAKSEIVGRVLGDVGEPRLPAQRLAPADGELIWLLDRPAAARLT